VYWLAARFLGAMHYRCRHRGFPASCVVYRRKLPRVGMQDDLHDATGCGTRAPCMVRAQPSLRSAVSALAIGGRFASIWPRKLSRSRRLGASGRHPALSITQCRAARPVEPSATVRRLQLTPPARRARDEMATRGFCATGWYASIAVRPTQIRRTACPAPPSGDAARRSRGHGRLRLVASTALRISRVTASG
jgi:hypothetical protein